MFRIAQFYQHFFDWDAEHLASNLRHDRIGTRTDIGHIALDHGRPIAL